MKYTRIFFTLTALLFVSAIVHACPMCNVHNYMYSSIQSASQIYVYAPHNSRKAIITEVLKGPHKVGEHLKCKDLKGVYVQCIPGALSDGMFFGEYEEQDLEEIKWILSGDSLVHSDREALQAIIGISNEYVSAAYQYIDQHYDRMLAPLILLADSLNRQVVTSQDRNYDWYIFNLHAVIFHRNNPVINLYAQHWMSEYTGGGWVENTEVSWAKPFYLYEVDFFESLLSQSLRMDSTLGKKYAQQLVDKIPTLGERGAVGVFYALLNTNCLDPYDLAKLITEDQHDAFAYAVIRYDSFYNRKHSKEKADEYNEFAFQYIKDPNLKMMLDSSHTY